MATNIETGAGIFDLDKKPIDLEGKPLTVGRALALVLVTQNKSADPLRAWTLAQKLTNPEVPKIDLDPSDVSFIKDSMKDFLNFSVLVKGQLLEKLG